MSNHSQAPVVWLLTDNKPGHKNQLKGLGNRLRVLTGAALYWISAEEYPVPLWRACWVWPQPWIQHCPNRP